MQSPEKYLKELGIQLSCAVSPEDTAKLDEAHRVSVNYETYFFSDTEQRDRFIAAPFEYTGLVTDPVNSVRFQPGPRFPTRTHGGRLFYLSSAVSVAKFDATPASYALPTLTMIPQEAASK